MQPLSSSAWTIPKTQPMNTSPVPTFSVTNAWFCCILFCKCNQHARKAQAFLPCLTCQKQLPWMHEVEPGHASACRGRSMAPLPPCKASVSSLFPHWRSLAEGPSAAGVAPHNMRSAEQRTVPTQLHIWLGGSFGSCSPTAELAPSTAL